MLGGGLFLVVLVIRRVSNGLLGTHLTSHNGPQADSLFPTSQPGTMRRKPKTLDRVPSLLPKGL